MKIAFYKAKGNIFDTIVRFWTASLKEKFLFKWRNIPSHCELIFSDNLFFSSSPRDGGCRFKLIDQDINTWDFIDILITDEQEKIVRAFCESVNGKKYDWLGIFFSQFLQFNIEDKSRYFCSEVCIKALQEVNLFYWIQDPSNKNPKQLKSLFNN